MPIAIDSSSPAITAVDDSARTTAAFSPPKDSVIVALAGDDYSFAAPTISNTGSLSFTQVVAQFESGAPFGLAAIWVAPCPTAKSGITVTTTSAGGGFAQVLKVLVLTGADLDDPVGASGSGSATTSSLSVSTAYTAEATGSIGVILANDSNGSVSVSVGGDTAYTYNGGISGAAIVKATTGTEGAAVGFSITASGSREWNWGAVEIRPGPEAFLPRPPLIAGQAAALNRSYYW